MDEPGLSPLEPHRTEALRLLEVAARSWALEGPVSEEDANRLREQVRAGSMGGRLLPAPSGGGAGLALWPKGSPVGRRAILILDVGFRTGPALGQFVDRLRSDNSEGPLLSIEDGIAGIQENVRTAVLAGRGFRQITRIDMFYRADAPLPKAPVEPPGLRTLRAEDLPSVARFLRESYADFPLDLALFRTSNDPEEDLRGAARFLLGGELGAWWSDASFAVVDPADDGRLLAAVIVNEHRGALITELGVVPEARGRGLGRVLLRRAIEATRRRGADRVRLVVTLANRRAHALYISMGFEPDPRNVGSLWIDPEALGLSQIDSPYSPRAAPIQLDPAE